jgi:hypothetical protein
VKRRLFVAALIVGALQVPTARSAAAGELASGASRFAATTATAFQQTEEDRGHRYRFMGRLLGTAFADRVRVGGEIELGKYETMLAGLPGIQVKSYDLRGVMQVILWPNHLSPYFGGAVGVHVIRLDDDAIESVITSMKIDNFGIALGGQAFVGIQLPITPDVSLFTEARAGAVFDVIDPASVEMGVRGLDGYSGMTGLRMRF